MQVAQVTAFLDIWLPQHSLNDVTGKITHLLSLATNYSGCLCERLFCL